MNKHCARSTLCVCVCVCVCLFSYVSVFSLSFSCQVSPSLLNDNDNDHSFIQVSVQKALTCSEGRAHGPWPRPCFGRITRAMQEKLVFRYSCATLVPLGMKWASTCAGDGEVFEGNVLCVSVGMGCFGGGCCCGCLLCQCCCRCVGCCMVHKNDMSRLCRFQKTLSVFEHKLACWGFISIAS